MADRSLGARLGLAANVLIVTGLALGLRNRDPRPMGVPEVKAPTGGPPGVSDKGVPTELYCPSNDPPIGPDGTPCGAKLTRRQEDEEDTLFCLHPGPIDEDDADTSPPRRP